MDSRKAFGLALLWLVGFAIVFAAADMGWRQYKASQTCPRGLGQYCVTQNGKARTQCLRGWKMYPDENCAYIWGIEANPGTICGSFAIQRGACR